VRRVPVALAGAVGALLLAACSGSGSEPQAADASALPSTTPPAGFREQAVGELSFFVPADWVRVAPAEQAVVEGGELELALRAPVPEGEPGPVALALVDPTPDRGARKEADSLVRIKRDVQQVPDVSADPITLPGFSYAVLVSYDEQLATGVAQHTDVLVGDLDDGTLVTVTVKADRARYDADQLGAISRTAGAGTRS
jgi:hypothetical protein